VHELSPAVPGGVRWRSGTGHAPCACTDLGGVGTGVVTIKITRRWHVALALAAAAAVQSACSRSDAERTARAARTASGSVDAGSVDAEEASTAVFVASAPGVHVTKTDGRSIRKAMAFRLTPAGLAAFMRAADTVAALARGDSVVRAYLNVTISDAGSIDAEAGRRWLEANQKVRDAIRTSGLSVEDYYVGAIAIATAERFLNHPKRTPLTPPLARNALLLQSHGSDLARLHQLRRDTILRR
jgi:hypothetical protein